MSRYRPSLYAAGPSARLLVILEKTCATRRHLAGSMQASACLVRAEDVIRQAALQSRRELTRALKLIARADMALRSNAPSKRWCWKI